MALFLSGGLDAYVGATGAREIIVMIGIALAGIYHKNDVSSKILRKYADDLDTGRLVHIHRPTYWELERKLAEKGREAAAKL